MNCPVLIVASGARWVEWWFVISYFMDVIHSDKHNLLYLIFWDLPNFIVCCLFDSTMICHYVYMVVIKAEELLILWHGICLGIRILRLRSGWQSASPVCHWFLLGSLNMPYWCYVCSFNLLCILSSRMFSSNWWSLHKPNHRQDEIGMRLVGLAQVVMFELTTCFELLKQSYLKKYYPFHSFHNDVKKEIKQRWEVTQCLVCSGV